MATYDLTQGIPTSLKEGDILNCPYSGNVITLTLPRGNYKLECWGSKGGIYTSSNSPGKGGYSHGELNLNDDTPIFLYAGGKPNGAIGGFNGGGKGASSYGSGGGGGTDIRIGQDSLYARVIVAGAGGGSSQKHSSGEYGGDGGGTNGINGRCTAASYDSNAYGKGGTQTSGGDHTTTWSGSFTNAGFGTGGSNTHQYGSGGGGGWYGGGAGQYEPSGGGSGYVYTSSTSNNYPTGCLLDNSMYLENAETIAGNVSFFAPNGSLETGHNDNGYIRITIISIHKCPIKIKRNNQWKDTSKVFVKNNSQWIEVTENYENYFKEIYKYHIQE